MATRRRLLRVSLTSGGGFLALLGTACGAQRDGAPGGGAASTAPVTLELFHEWDGVRTKLVEDMCAEIVSMFFRIDEEEPGFPLGAAVPPYNSKNAKAKSKTVANYVWVYAIPQASQQHEPAWTLLKYISLEEGARKALLAQKRPAAVRKFNEEKAYRDLNPYWSDVVLKNLEGSQAMPQSPAWDDISKVINKAVESVLDGKVGVKDALSQAASEAQNLLDMVK